MHLFRAAVATALCFALVPHADAVPMLRLTTNGGAYDVIVADGGVGDASAAGDGIVAFNGSLGNWVLNVATGVSKPAIGTADAPELDLNSVNLSSSGAASTVDIWLTDTGFNAKSSLTGVVAAIGGTTSGQVSYRTFFDPNNIAFSQANELTDLGPLSGLAFASTATNALSSLTQFSLTLLVTITHAASTKAQISSFDAIVKVPEPGSLLLLGAGLLVVGFAAQRRRPARRPS